MNKIIKSMVILLMKGENGGIEKNVVIFVTV